MSEWFESLDGIHTRVLQTLKDGVADRNHIARHPTLATATKDGMPGARTVVLRGIDNVSGTVEIHTDIASDKVHALLENPVAELHIWDAKSRLQIRLGLEVYIVTGNDDAMERWSRVPETSRKSYGSVPHPGTPISDPLAYEKLGRSEFFAVLTCEFVAIDAVYIGEQHRRARFTRDSDWVGEWLVP